MRRGFNNGAGACAAFILTVLLAASGLGQELRPKQELNSKPPGDQIAEMMKAGRYAEATARAEELLARAEKEAKEGGNKKDVAFACLLLATLYSNQGFYERALPLFVRAREIFQQESDPFMEAAVLNNMAMMYAEQADYKRAIPLLEQVVETFRKAKFEDDAAPNEGFVNKALNNLASIYFQSGDVARGIPMLEQTLRAKESSLGREHPDLAGDLNNLGVVYSAQGDDERSMEYHLRALNIREKLGLQNPQLAQSLSNVASKYLEQKEYARALPLLERSLKVYEESLGPKHPDVANALEKLAEVHFYLHKDVGRAEAELQRALDVRVAVLGEKHPDTARSLLTLASMYLARDQRDYERALPLVRRALSIYETTLGAEHPDIPGILTGLSEISTWQGNYDESIKFLQRGSDIEEKNLALILNIGSQRQKQQYLQAKVSQTNVRVVTHVQRAPQKAEAARMALTAILRYKTRGLDAFVNQIENLRRHATPEARQSLDRLVEVQSQLAGLTISGAGSLRPEARRARIALLRDEQERLEDAVSRSSAGLRASTQAVTLDAVRRALPADSALVEFFFYVPYKLTASGREYTTPRYVAYVLRPQQDAPPQFVDLGPMSTLHEEIVRFRDLLQTPKSTAAQISAVARGLDERLMRPVRNLLGPTGRIFLAPEGQLNLIPFGALVDENGRYLVENYSLNYLTSGRDLLRFQSLGAGATGTAAVVAAPQFDLTRPVVTCGPARRRREQQPGTPDAQVEYRDTDFTRFCYPTLEGTAQEAARIRVLMPGALVLTGKGATETALKALSRPRILHIATHGFFLPDQPSKMLGGRELIWESKGAPQYELPLLRSGLVLAGVKQGRSGPSDDGVLTALEAAGLDLFGTKLVVLSACDTGLGEVSVGEGVYGLRRALMLAGSETQVISLWKVSDNVTHDLMGTYYERLRAGEGRSEAMRAVQLAMLKSGGKAKGSTDVSHPFYWASFIPSGDWRSLTVEGR